MLNLRHDFPLLRRQIDGRPVVYLDSAATSLKPDCVVEAETRYNTEFTANIHRGNHALSEEASHAYDMARRTVAEFIGTTSDAVAFNRNATEGLNTVAFGLGLSKADVVLVPVAEHHSNIVPWMRVADARFVPQKPGNPIDLSTLEHEIQRNRPRVITVSAVSNVTGIRNPVEEICAMARACGVLSVVDASQAVAHERMSIRELGCDYVVFSGHKTLGPTGIGVLAGTTESMQRLEPLMVGGGAVESVSAGGFTLKSGPQRFESGTPNIAGAIGLAAAILYLQRIGFDAIQTHEEVLNRELQHCLAGLAGIEVIAGGGGSVPIAAVVPDIGYMSPDEISRMLSDTYQIMVRSGFHCTQPLFRQVEAPMGAIRVSACFYNTVDELHYFADSLQSLIGRLGMASGSWLSKTAA